MWSRRILIVVIGLAAGLFDASWTGWLPAGTANIHMSLILVAILAIFSSQERVLTGAIAAGLVLDVLLPSVGFTTLRLLLVAFAIRGVSHRYLTNRSIFGSWALGLFGLALDRVLLLGITWLRGSGGGIFIPEIRAPLFVEVIWMVFGVGVAFVIYAAFTKRFMPLVIRR